ncbi:MAG: hypothetical protein ACU85U_13405 [Gammaproteobacteria bacterium]|jgi:hypothetical protein
MQQQITVRVSANATEPARVCTLLGTVHGIANAGESAGKYIIDYDPRVLGCAEVIARLRAAGAEPTLSVLEHMRLKLRCYRDAILREEQMNELGWDSFVREIYVSRFRHRRHGRRDDRPRNWRHYSGRTPT